jgi:ABC-2 type transport system permease protein
LAVVLLVMGNMVLPFIPLVIVAAAVLSCFTAGMSLALSAANVYLRDLKYLWSIVSQAWFFSTPIVYPISRVEGRIPDWAFQIYANLPMAVVVRVFRHLLYDLSIPPLVDWGLMLGYSLAMLFAGWWVFRRLEGRFAEEL